MAEPWQAEREVSEGLARALIEERFPDLAGSPLELLGVGWDNSAWLAGGQWVFRFPRRTVAVALLEREARLLPALAPRLPLPVPVVERLARGDERYPWPFAAHRLVPGRTACRAALDAEARGRAAEPLGRFLAALHGFPVTEAAALGVGGDELGRTDVVARAARARAAFAELERAGAVDRSLRQGLDRVVDETPPAAPRPSPVLVHGDLYVRHVLVDDRGAPAGVIDWGDVHAGDPAVDLALAWSFLPPRARGALRRAYGGADDATWRLARFRAACHSASLARFALGTGDEALAREAGLALRWLTEAVDE